MGDRCTGNCCRSFVLTGLGTTPEEIDDFLRGKKGTRVVDGEQIADMIVPLRRVLAGVPLPNGELAQSDPPGGQWVCTCKHFDAATSNCGIYSSRPEMCRDFPNGRRCEHGEACAWDAGREGRWPPPPVHYAMWTMVGSWVQVEMPEEVREFVDPGSKALVSRRQRRVHLVTVDRAGKPRRAAQEHEDHLSCCVGAG